MYKNYKKMDKPLLFLTIIFCIFGLIMIFYGALQVGIAFKDDEPDKKAKGIKWCIAGSIVTAVAMGFDKFVTF